MGHTTATPLVRPDRRPDRAPDRAALAALALGTFVLHALANWWSPYGVHRDELLYLAMGRHLRLWAMDFPPFIALAAQLTRAIGMAGGGTDLVAHSTVLLRLLPALAAAALVGLAWHAAAQLGGGRGARVLAALCVLASPLFLRAGSLFQPVVFDQLWWTLALSALIRLGQHAERTDPRGWLLLGVALGLGLLTKFSVAFIGAGVLVGVLVTPLRQALRTRWPWLATLLAAMIGAPSIVGQLRLGWPVAGQMAALRTSQLARVGAGEFLGGQLLLGPAVALGALGLWALLTRPALRGGRAAGVACAVAFALLLAGHGKAYYVGPIYPVLWAAGAVVLARADARWLGMAAVLVGAYGLVTFPLGVPVLPPTAMARYAARLGVGTETNSGDHLALPQDYADMLGWPGQARAVAAVFRSLPAADQSRTVILGGNYGEAGALDLYGPGLGLPPVVSPAGSFWFFGPGRRAGELLLVLADSSAAAPMLAQLCGEVRPAAPAVPDTLRAWLVPDEQHAWIFICRAPRQSVQQLWPSLAGRN